MSDNVTATEIAGFTTWGIPLLSAFVGTLVGFILKYFWDKNREKKNEQNEK